MTSLQQRKEQFAKCQSVFCMYLWNSGCPVLLMIKSRTFLQCNIIHASSNVICKYSFYYKYCMYMFIDITLIKVYI